MPGPLNVTDFKRYAAFGSGVGIEIGAQHLEVTAARVRPYGIDVLGATTIRDFGQRPAAQWGLEYARFLQEAGASHLAATVLLPRRETIVRQIALPGVAGIYNRHGYDAEKGQALAQLAALIERIVNPPADNVITMREAVS